ncbi:hypothetical protein, partial [Mycobacterium sp. IS-2888]|uniref:hypothetical protein n=1 Tax=Mycobacterium sp. IS-2888 TaxID=1834159 RepID=UPI001C377192
SAAVGRNGGKLTAFNRPVTEIALALVLAPVSQAGKGHRRAQGETEGQPDFGHGPVKSGEFATVSADRG